MSKKRQAVLIIHGMGEQAPMGTVRAFVDAVWTSDDTLVSPNKPDPASGGQRKSNASWSKPDHRFSSFEVRRIATEKTTQGNLTDFYEFYWAHMVQGTTWDQVRAWIFDLLLRNPFRRVPRGLHAAWVLLWIATLVVAGLAASTAWLASNAEAPALSLLLGLATAAAGWATNKFLIGYLGDVVRYVKAEPINIDRRQQIREAGVQLLERLIRSKLDNGEPEYDRIIVVAHSLGTIVAYDILSHAFARLNNEFNMNIAQDARQPQRAALERAVRVALGHEPRQPSEANLTIEKFREMQDAARNELVAMGTPWPVSDFITLGSPLTHAEFLMARDIDEIRALQKERVLPTCPPTLEHDGSTEKMHFTYRPKKLREKFKKIYEEETDTETRLQIPRVPHHAALFAYTKWTNIWSKHAWIFWGDIVSGPLGSKLEDGHSLFGIRNPEKNDDFCGILDVPVLPDLENGKTKSGHHRRLVTHTSYWSPGGATEDTPPATPHHIQVLRKVLDLGN